MISETLKPVTDAELAYVKHILPDLVDIGLLRCFPIDPEDQDSVPLHAVITDSLVRRSMPFARLYIQRTWDRTRVVNYELPSYALADDATHWLNANAKKFQPGTVIPAIPNGALIAMALLEGYRPEASGANVYFPTVLTPDYEQLRQLRLSVEAKARDQLAWEKLLREARASE